MDRQEQDSIARLRGLLHVTLSSRSSPPELYSWCQLVFPGCCYLSCATLVDSCTFATRNNLVERGSPQSTLQPAQQEPVTQDAVLHSSWPQRHPDLQILRDLTYWDSVIVVGIPHHTNASDPPPPTDAANLTGGDLSPNSSQESPPKRTEQLLSATSDAVSGAVSQTVDEEVNAKSVLILGLCGHNHDLERTLLSLRMLAHQLTPDMHSYQQQLIGQALHTASPSATATDASATAVYPLDLGLGAEASWVSSSMSYDTANAIADVSPDLPATAVDPEIALLGAAASLSPCPSPFSELEEGPSFPSEGADRQGRRREHSGSLPLEQMFSRVPSPLGSVSGLDRQSSDGPSRPASRRTSRLGSALDLNHLLSAASQQLPVSVDPNSSSAQQSAARNSADGLWPPCNMRRRTSRLSHDNLREVLADAQVQQPGTGFPPINQVQTGGGNLAEADASIAAAATGRASSEAEEQLMRQSIRPDAGLQEPMRPLRTVYSGQGLPSDSTTWQSFSQGSPTAMSSPLSHQAELASRLAGASPDLVATQPLSTGSSRGISSFEAEASEEAFAAAAALRSAPRGSSEASRSRDDMLVAQLEAEAEARIAQQHRHHPWLLYFYDQETERDYRIYHARQMAVVDAVSLTIAVIIYLRLGFASGHAYATGAPVTFVLILAMLLTWLFAVTFMKDRVRRIREPLIRAGAFAYLAAQCFGSTPAVLQTATVEQIRSLPFLARYSNTSTLVTTSVTLMVRLHIHVPCQLINFAMSAAVLPQAICQAGFREHSFWRCCAVGISIQFVIGLVLSTVAVALNERRVRGMYMKSTAAHRLAQVKAKMS